MKNAEPLRALSGRPPQQQGDDGAVSQPPHSARRSPPQPSRRRIDGAFRKYCWVTGGLLGGSVVLVVLPLWIVHPPYGKACLLSLPPMILCALSWAAGAWWAWDKGFQVLMAVTLGGMPVRMILVLAWLWIVTTIPGVPIVVFVICMMWHWVLLSVPEFAMMLELGRQSQQWRARPRSDQPAAPANQSKDGGNLS